MSQKWLIARAVLVTFSLFLIFQNCSEPQISLRRTYASADSKADFCTSPVDKIESHLKFIFVVDRSGSNHTNYNRETLQPLIGNDPTGDIRFNNLINFVRDFNGGDGAGVYFSLATIAGEGKIVQGFTNDKNAFLTELTNQHADTQNLDNGSTNYIDTIKEVRELISTDISLGGQAVPKISSNYVIFFLTDGVPYMATSGNPGDSGDPTNLLDDNGIQKDYYINLELDSLLQLEPQHKELVEGVQINTAYYYQDYRDNLAVETLNRMADTGYGNFLEFGNGEDIDFTQFSLPIRFLRFDVKEFWAHNASSVWEGAELKYDADTDGLSDELEALLGSDPNLYDTDFNGVGDGVEYRVSGNTQPCHNADCSYVGIPYSTGVCDDNLITRNPPVFADTDNDYLNDCEELILGSKPDNPDTNGDYIPDHLAFINNISLTSSSLDAINDPDNDGISNYDEIKLNTPTQMDNDLISHAKNIKYTTQLVSESVNTDCYDIQFFDMSYFSKDDKIRVYILENTKALNEKRIMRTAEKELSNGGVSFVESDFK